VSRDLPGKGWAALHYSELQEEIEAAHVTVAAHGHVESNTVHETGDLWVAHDIGHTEQRNTSRVTRHTSHVTRHTPSRARSRTHAVACAGQRLEQKAGDCEVGNLEQGQQRCRQHETARQRLLKRKSSMLRDERVMCDV
jgi:hypothetical protein